MSGWTLTVRHGPRVERERFAKLGPAVEALERRAKEIRMEGPAEPARMLREFGPGQQVSGRLELSSGGLRRRRSAGVDVMGDGRFVPYSGAVRRRALETEGSPFAAVREALS